MVISEIYGHWDGGDRAVSGRGEDLARRRRLLLFPQHHLLPFRKTPDKSSASASAFIVLGDQRGYE